MVLENKNLPVWLIFLISLFVCLANSWGFSIYILDEAKNAEAAREMWETGKAFFPTFNGELRSDKPPLHYFFMQMAFFLFGVSDFSARFFSGVFGALSLTLMYHFTKTYIGVRVANWSWLLGLAALLFVIEFHLAVPDPYLIFFISAALFCFYHYYIKRQSVFLFLFYLFLGLGVLSKGPIAIVLPGLCVLLFLISEKQHQPKKILAFRPFLGGLFILLINVPWFYFAHKHTDGLFTEGFFLKHNISRFSSTMEGHGGIFLITWAFVLLGLLPFSFFLPQALIETWKIKKKNSLLKFSFWVSTAFIVFFSISSTKLPNYTMPCYPFLLIILGQFIDSWIDNLKLKKSFYPIPNRISFWLLVVIMFSFPILGYLVFTEFEPQLSEARYWAFGLVIFSIGGFFATWFYKKNKLSYALFSIAFTWVLGGLFTFYFLFPKLTALSPVEYSRNILNSNDSIIVFKGYDPAFLFHYQRTFPATDKPKKIEEFLRLNPEAKVITKHKFGDELKELKLDTLMYRKSLFENYKTMILSNPKATQ